MRRSSAPEGRQQQPRPAELEVRQLLRQARVHVVEVRHAAATGRATRPIAPPSSCECTRSNFHFRPTCSALRASSASSGTFASDGPIFTRRTNGGRQLRCTFKPGKRDVSAERIGDEIDRVAEVGQRADPVVFAERRAPRLEERLGGDHQDAHGSVRPVAPARAVRRPIETL